MLNEYIERKIYFDDELSIGLSNFDHLIIEQTIDEKTNAVVIFEENINSIRNYVKEAIQNHDNKNLKIYDRTQDQITTKIYVSSVYVDDFTFQYNEIIISQNDYDNVVLDGNQLIEFLDELKTNFKKNEGV